MVAAMATLPPAMREATAEVRKKDPNHCVKHEDMSYGKVPYIICNEHNLMPEETQNHSRRYVHSHSSEAIKRDNSIK